MSDLLESEIESRVCRYANKKDILTRKFTSPQHRSVPDRLFIFPSGLVVFIEFKRRKGKLSDGQKREVNKLIKRRQWVYVVNDVHTGKLLVDALARLEGGAIASRFPLVPM